MTTRDTHDGDEDGQPAFAVLEANDYKQRRRLKELLDARQKVEEKLDQADELYYTGEINEQGRDILVLHAVREFIRQGWTLLLDHVNSLGEDEQPRYFANRPLGSIDFDTADEPPVEIDGLYQYLEMPEYVEVSWTETVEWRHGNDTERVRTERQTIPIEVSERAYMAMVEFLAEEHDLEIQFEELQNERPTRELGGDPAPHPNDVRANGHQEDSNAD